MKTLIRNVRLISDGLVSDTGWLYMEGEQIRGIGWDEAGPDPAVTAENIIDGTGLYAAPGLIDLHLHGGGGCDFMDGTKEAIETICRYHSRHGITSMLATTLAGEPKETMDALQAIARYAPEIQTCNVLGVHLEGPYFCMSQRGAQDPRYIKLPDIEEMKRYLSVGCIRRVSLAPELQGAKELILFLREQGIVVSAGHTDADYDTICESTHYGVSLMTHLYSGMKGVHRKGPFRYGGAVEAGLLLDDVDVELIADGCHLPGCLLQLVRRCKPKEKIILVTDAMRGAGLPEGARTYLGSLEKGQEVVIKDQVAMLPDMTSFAGSVAAGDRLVRTMHTLGEAQLAEAVRMMTENPARILGIDQRKGRLQAGMDADVILFDEDVRIHDVWVMGRRQTM